MKCIYVHALMALTGNAWTTTENKMVFNLFLLEIEPTTTRHHQGQAGVLMWFDLNSITQLSINTIEG